MKFSLSLLLIFLSTFSITYAEKEIRAIIDVSHEHHSVIGYTEKYRLTIFTEEGKLYALLSALDEDPYAAFAIPKSVSKRIHLSQKNAEKLDKYFSVSLGLKDEIRERESHSGLNKDTCIVRLLTFNGSESKEVEFYHLFGIEYLDKELLTPLQLRQMILGESK